jgi:hypothetical protein
MMAFTGDEATQDPPRAESHVSIRWECHCRQPPVLLATYNHGGRIHIKARDRYWHVSGAVQTVCPRCGSEHTLDPQRGEASSLS